MKPHKITDIDRFASRIVKIFTNKNRELSPYIFDNEKKRWVVVSKKGWVVDKNNKKFAFFVHK